MGRTEKGVDRGLEIAVGGIEEELGRCIIHAVGLQVERFDLLVHGCRSGPGEGSHAAPGSLALGEVTGWGWVTHGRRDLCVNFPN